jgi:hypothetical protein
MVFKDRYIHFFNEESKNLESVDKIFFCFSRLSATT